MRLLGCSVTRRASIIAYLAGRLVVVRIRLPCLDPLHRDLPEV